MSLPEVEIANYLFWNFQEIRGNLVTFRVRNLDQFDVNNTDKEKVEVFLRDLGKWENLVRTGLYLLSELKIIQLEQTTLENYERAFGIELYNFEVSIGSLHEHLGVSFYLKPEERHRRERANLEPILPVEEIYNQIVNIPKWKAFEKTIKIAREQWEKK